MLLSLPDVENSADFRQYYTGSFMLLKDKIIYIRSVQEARGEAAVVEYETFSTPAGRERGVATYAGLQGHGLQYGCPKLGMREVDGQLYYLGCYPSRNGRRGHRPDSVHVRHFTGSVDSVAMTMYTPAGPGTALGLYEVFFPTFRSFNETRRRLLDGESLGGAINHNVGLFVRPDTDVMYVAFRGNIAGYYDRRGFHHNKGCGFVEGYVQSLGETH